MTCDFNTALYLRTDSWLAPGSGKFPPEATFARDAASTNVAASASIGSIESFSSIYCRRVVPGGPDALAATVASRFLPRAAAAAAAIAMSVVAESPGRRVGLFCTRR